LQPEEVCELIEKGELEVENPESDCPAITEKSVRRYQRRDREAAMEMVRESQEILKNLVMQNGEILKMLRSLLAEREKEREIVR